jgi:hypothetical protein
MDEKPHPEVLTNPHAEEHAQRASRSVEGLLK